MQEFPRKLRLSTEKFEEDRGDRFGIIKALKAAEIITLIHKKYDETAAEFNLIINIGNLPI